MAKLLWTQKQDTIVERSTHCVIGRAGKRPLGGGEAYSSRGVLVARSIASSVSRFSLSRPIVAIASVFPPSR